MMSQKSEQILAKIVSLEEAKKIVQQYKLKSQKVVFTNGCFDILHKGHITLINKAADFGNKVIVGLNTDHSVKKLKGDSRPIHNENDRALLLASLAFVDLVVLFDQDTPLELIKTIMPDVIVKGGDYKEEEIVGAKEIKKNGGEVFIIPLEENHSTTRLISILKQDN